MTDEDLSVFYDTTEFAVTVTPLKGGNPFPAIPGVVDGEALEGRVTAARRRLLYPTGPNVVDGDLIAITGLGVLSVYNGQYRVLDPQRVSDGLETACHIVLQTAAP